MNDFMLTNYDYNGVEASYTMKPAFNLFSNLGFMSESDAKGNFLDFGLFIALLTLPFRYLQ